MPFVIQVSSVHPNYLNPAEYQEAKELLAFRERPQARIPLCCGLKEKVFCLRTDTCLCWCCRESMHGWRHTWGAGFR